MVILRPAIGFEDSAEAAHNCRVLRRKGLTPGTIDILIATICLRHNLTLISVDSDFDEQDAVSAKKVVEEIGDWIWQVDPRLTGRVSVGSTSKRPYSNPLPNIPAPQPPSIMASCS